MSSGGALQLAQHAQRARPARRAGQDGGAPATLAPGAAASGGPLEKRAAGNGCVKKKRRRGKHKRGPAGRAAYPHAPPHAHAATNAPYNNNQFLMEIHAPGEPGAGPAGAGPRTRDSSFSVDSDENYFYPLPENEEDFLIKEFSSVYEDAVSERLASLTKPQLVAEYLALEARLDREAAAPELQKRLRDQEQRIRDLELANQRLSQHLERLRRQRRTRPRSTQSSASTVDSDSDSSSTSMSTSSTCSSRSASPLTPQPPRQNGFVEPTSQPGDYPLVNGFHSEELYENGINEN